MRFIHPVLRLFFRGAWWRLFDPRLRLSNTHPDLGLRLGLHGSFPILGDPSESVSREISSGLTLGASPRRARLQTTVEITFLFLLYGLLCESAAFVGRKAGGNSRVGRARTSSFEPSSKRKSETGDSVSKGGRRRSNRATKEGTKGGGMER